MTLFDMTSLDDTPHEDIIPSDMWTHDVADRKAALDHLCQQVIDKFLTFTFNTANDTNACGHDPVHMYAKELLSLGLFYFEFVDSVREGDGLRILRCYKYLLLLFKSSARSNYSCEVFNMLFQYYYLLSPRQSQQLIWNRCINTHGIKGQNISCDLYMEHLNRVLKEAAKGKGPNKTSALTRLGKALGTLEPVLCTFDSDNNVKTPSCIHSYVSNEADRDIILKSLNDANVFELNTEHKREVCKIKGNLLHQVSTQELKVWILKRMNV